PPPRRVPAPPLSTHRISRPLLLVVVTGASPAPAGRPPPPPGVDPGVEEGFPPLQALRGVAAFLSRGRFLPDLCYRRPARTLPRRARPPAISAPRVTHARVHPPAIRSPPHRPPPVTALPATSP